MLWRGGEVKKSHRAVMTIKYQSNFCHLLTRCPALLSNKADPVVNAVCLMRSLLAPQFLRSVSQMKCVTCTGLNRDGRGSRGCIPQAVAISWTSSLLTCSPYLTWEFPRYLCGRFLPLQITCHLPREALLSFWGWRLCPACSLVCLFSLWQILPYLPPSLLIPVPSARL